MKAQDDHWLDAGRIKLYSALALVFFLVIALGFIWYSNLISPNGYVIVLDFTVFWIAAQLGLAGHALDAYGVSNLHTAMMAIAPDVTGYFGWFYPPTFYLLILPLGLMPFLPAYLVFMLSTLTGYVAVIRCIFWRREVIWCLAGFPGIWLTLRFGQNSFLTAALAGAALLLLERRPVSAGVLIGLLSIKPHLALLFPIALIAMGAWSAVITATAVTIAFIAIAVTLLGTTTFGAWLYGLEIAKVWTETGAMPWSAMPTVFAFLRLLNVPVGLAYVAHGSVAILATVIVWKIWRQCTNGSLKSAALITATFLISPYLFEYDLVWLALPVAWVVKLGFAEGWFPMERELLALVWLLPSLMVIIANHTSVQIAPWAILALLGIILRRAHRTSWKRIS